MYNDDNGNNFWNLLDLFGIFLDAYSVYLGEKNLLLNDEQVNKLDTHLKQQDDTYLKKIIEQNNELSLQNQEIIRLLKKLNKE